MRLETIIVHSIIEKPSRLLLTPWRKYNDFFNDGCRNVWGLSPIIKSTYLYFGLVIPYFFISGFIPLSVQKIIEALFTVGTFIILAVWALYMPVLVVMTMLRAIRKVKHNVNELNTTLSGQPWKMTPKKLYTQPHSIIFLYLIYAKNEMVDFMDWFTQFFPFNLINPDGIRYPLTAKIRRNSRHIEGLIADMNIPLKYVGFEINMQNTNYQFEFYEQVKSIAKVLSKLEKGFKKNDYYVRKESGKIIVIAPHHLY
ncbi:hypothetical protein A3J17_03420 [Candidatus Curtissbacteria bacterium RIFCSPLOWO2_02_FULL_40_11]|nr:MAG: hypothetical protein A3J17_03420 [Candidatus Curtissbacteria bacterium RIFCSPLOWO2_02_FULL_40_11]